MARATSKQPRVARAKVEAAGTAEATRSLPSPQEAVELAIASSVGKFSPKADNSNKTKQTAKEEHASMREGRLRIPCGNGYVTLSLAGP